MGTNYYADFHTCECCKCCETVHLGKVIFETRMFLDREGDFDTTRRIVQSAADRRGVTIVGSDRDA